MAITRVLFPELEWFCYVDNIAALVAPLTHSKPDWLLAHSKFKEFLRFHGEKTGIPLHGIIKPTTRVENCLGWGIDTERMQVFIKKEMECSSHKPFSIPLLG